MLPMQKARVQSLAGEPRSHTLHKKPQKTKIKIKIEKVAKDVMLNVILFTTIKKLKTTHGVEKNIVESMES